MTISPQDLSKVQDSFALLRTKFDVTSMHFYEALFARAPQLRTMFRDDLAGQGMKFMTTLDAIVQKLGDEGEVSNEFTDLGRTHRSLGVHRGDFTPMEEALIDTLRIELGDEFSEDLERAWRAAFEEVSARMIGRGNIPD